MPSLSEFWDRVQVMDAWWIEAVDQMTHEMLNEVIRFRFISGDQGKMTRLEIVMHVVNHASYHRGFADELLGQIEMDVPFVDFPLYLREMYQPQC